MGRCLDIDERFCENEFLAGVACRTKQWLQVKSEVEVTHSSIKKLGYDLSAGKLVPVYSGIGSYS